MTASILITGVSGFIGSRLALRAKEFGCTVYGTSRTSAEYLTQILKLPVLAFDVLMPINNLPDVDTIIHCATPNDILSKDFEAGMNLSINGTRNLLEAARSAGIKNFVFFSTLQVYGSELSGIYDEDSPVCCESPYALNHYFGEEVCRMYSRDQGLNVVIVRPSNVYGTPDVTTTNRGTLVPMCFVLEAVRQETITLLSSGRQTRNFVSTDEVAEVVLGIVSNIPETFSIVNIASNLNCSILDMAKMVSSIYKERYNRLLDVVAKTDKPKNGNIFQVNSKLHYPRRKPEDSIAAMRETIFDLFDKKAEKIHG